jgi:hypothetical protein
MDILGIAPYNMKLKLQKWGQSMVELYVQELKKSIKELEIDNELDKFVKAHLGKMLKAFSTILGLLLLPLSGCESYFDFSCEYGMGKNKPYRILIRGTPSVWIRLLRRISLKLLVKIVKRYHQMSNATKSRFKVTLAVDSTTLLKLASKLGLVGVFWSGQLKKEASSIQMVVLYAVIGEGKLLIPLDMRIRRPDPTARGRRCKEQPELVLEMIRDFKTRCLAKGVDPNGWFIVMDSWYCSNDMLDKISDYGFIVVIEGKSNYVFYMDIQGNPLRYNVSGLSEVVRWREGNQRDIDYARANVISPTFGEVTLILFEDDDELRYLIMRPNIISSIRIIVAYKLRWWIEEFFKICKSYLKIEKFQMVKEVYGHICLRIICFILLCYCAKKVCRETIQKMVRKLNRYWFEWFPQILDWQAFS